MGIETQSSLDTLKQQLFEYAKLQLGDQIIDLELDPAHFESAYRNAIGTYRQRAQNAYEESYSFLELVANVNIYDNVNNIIHSIRLIIIIGTA